MGITEARIKHNFNEFMRLHSEYAQDAETIALSLYSQTKNKGLPLVEDTFALLESATQVYENASGDHYAAFQEITGYTEPCARELTADIQKLAPGADEFEVTTFIAQCEAKHEVDQIRQASQGLTPAVRTALIDFTNTNHLEKIAEIAPEATIFAMLDEECIELRDIVEEWRREGLRTDLTPQERYNVLLSSINDELSGHLRAHVKTLAARNTPVQEAKRPPANFEDFLRQFKPQI